MVDTAVEFYSSILMSSRLSNSIDIDLKIVKNLATKEGVAGDCIWEDDNHRPRFFTVRLSYDGADKFGSLLTILGHEMVHVKQYARGQLKDMHRYTGTKWMGKNYNCHKMSYWDYPWEIEAYGMERGLYTRLCDANKNIVKYCGYP